MPHGVLPPDKPETKESKEKSNTQQGQEHALWAEIFKSPTEYYQKWVDQITHQDAQSPFFPNLNLRSL